MLRWECSRGKLHNMLIRNAHPDDIPALARVHVESWRTTYAGIVPSGFLADLDQARSAARFEELMARPAYLCVVAADERDGIVGFASGGPERTGDPIYKGELYACYLLHAYQRQGIGASMFHNLLAQLASAEFNSMLAWVLVQNPACRFYEKLGGQRLREGSINIGGVEIREIAYGWTNLGNQTELIAPRQDLTRRRESSRGAQESALSITDI